MINKLIPINPKALGIPVPVLPTVYGDALSYGEQVGVLTHKTNECIESINELIDDIDAFEEDITTQQNNFETQITNQQSDFETQITNQQSDFETQITNQQSDFETQIADAQSQFETSMINRQNSYENTVDGKVEGLENSYEEFLENYERQFGVANSYGNSVTDAISQAKATETNTALNDINTTFSEYKYKTSELAWGTINSSGDITALSYRVYLQNIHHAETYIKIVAKTGWKVRVAFYTNGSYSSGTDFVDEVVIPKGSDYRFIIKRTIDDTSETAERVIFLNGLLVMSSAVSQDNIDELINYDLDVYFNSFERGSIDNTGTTIVNTHRIRSKYIVPITEPMKLMCNTGYIVVAFYYDSNNDYVGNVSGETIVIDKNHFVKLLIAQNPEYSGEADIDVFMSNVKVQSCVASEREFNKIKNLYEYTNGYEYSDSISASQVPRGSLDGSGNYVSTIRYRVTTDNILTKPYDQYIKVNSNFRTNIALYDANDNVTYVSGYDGSDKFIPMNTKYRISVARSVDNTSEIASNIEFLSALTFITKSMNYNSLDAFTNVNGKIINFLGDSYVQNHNGAVSDTWHYKFAMKHGMVYRNYGANGTSITPSTDGGTNNSISERASLMANADYIVVIGGKNDYNIQVPLATFKTAMINLIKNLVTTFMPTQICFFTPWMVSEETEVDTGSSAKTITLFEYINVMHEVCKEYSVPCYDTGDSGIYVWNAQFRHDYFQGDNDISHLNASGHDYFLPRAEKYLLSVLK